MGARFDPVGVVNGEELDRQLGQFSYQPTRDAQILGRVIKLGIHRPVQNPRGEYQLEDDICQMIDNLAERLKARRVQADRLAAACKPELRMPGMGEG